MRMTNSSLYSVRERKDERAEKREKRRREEKRGVVVVGISNQSNQQMEGLSTIPGCTVRYGTYHEIPSVNYLPVLLRYRFVGILLPKVSDGDVPFMLRYWYGSARVMETSGPISVSAVLLHFIFSTALCTIATTTTTTTTTTKYSGQIQEQLADGPCVDILISIVMIFEMLETAGLFSY